MRVWYGPNYREAARQFTVENPDWEPLPPVDEEAAPRSPAPAVTPFGKGKGKGELGDGRFAEMPPLPVLGRASVAASAADVGSTLTGEGGEEAESLRGTEGTDSTFVTPRTLMGRMENPYDPDLETLVEYKERMHKDCLKARHLGMELDLNKLQLKLDKAELINQLYEYSEEDARETMRQMLSDTLDASRPVTMSPDLRRQMDRRMHALMELFADKHMNQDFIRIRQADAREPVASPPPARSRRETSTECAFPHKAPPREEVEEAPMEVKTPGVLAAEAAKAGVIPEAFLQKQMGVLDAMLTKLGGETKQKASTIKIAPTVDWPTLHESDSDVKEFFQQFKDTAKLANDGKGMEWREMLQILPNRLHGSRLKYAKLILKQARNSEILEDPEGHRKVFAQIEAKLMRFSETAMQKRSRVLKMYADCYKGKQTALQFEPAWENVFLELESIGMTRTEDEAYIV